MKRIVLLIIALIFTVNSFSQTITGRKTGVRLSISEEKFKPPVINIVNKKIEFYDTNNNNRIDANENCSLNFTYTNTGKGPGEGLVLNVSASGTTDGISFDKQKTLPDIQVGAKRTVNVPLNSNINTGDGKLHVMLKIDEPNGFGSDDYNITIETKAFEAPMLQITNHKIIGSGQGNQLERKKTFTLEILVANTGEGIAEDVKIQLSLPDKIFLYEGNESTVVPEFAARKKQLIQYGLMISEKYTSNSIDFPIKISEKYGKYARNDTISLEIGAAFEETTIVINPIEDETKKYIPPQIESDVDKKVPVTGMKRNKAVAVIIGNREYDSESIGTVEYAINDAYAFKMYCQSTLGIPEYNIIYYENMTEGQFTNVFGNNVGYKSSDLYKLLYEVDAQELFLFYSGHGIPAADSNLYLAPRECETDKIDLSGYSIKQLNYNLSQMPVPKIAVFLDACHSGYSLQLSVPRIPKDWKTIHGKDCVIITATKKNQPATWYAEKKHGVFTYCLLKAIQDNAGKHELTYRQLYDILNDKDTGIPKISLTKGTVQHNPDINGKNMENDVFLPLR